MTEFIWPKRRKFDEEMGVFAKSIAKPRVKTSVKSEQVDVVDIKLESLDLLAIKTEPLD